MDKELDRKACEIIASRVIEISIFKGKSLEEIASKIPECQGLSQPKSFEEGIVSRNFGNLSVIVYDLKIHKETYKNELTRARASHLTRGLPLTKNFLYALLEHGIKEDTGYIVLGIREKINRSSFL